MAATDWLTHDRSIMFIHFGLHSNPAEVGEGRRIPTLIRDVKPRKPWPEARLYPVYTRRLGWQVH